MSKLFFQLQPVQFNRLDGRGQQAHVAPLTPPYVPNTFGISLDLRLSERSHERSRQALRLANVSVKLPARLNLISKTSVNLSVEHCVRFHSVVD